MKPKIGQRWFWRWSEIEEIIELIGTNSIGFKVKVLQSVNNMSGKNVYFNLELKRFPTSTSNESLKYLPGQDKING